MSLEIKVPPVGESITEVILSKWIKKDGDQVAMDEVIAELESDKATFELTAETAGTLKTIANEGDTLAVGALVCKIEDGGDLSKAEITNPKAESPATDLPETKRIEEASPANSTSSETREIKVPAVGESITEVTLTKWLKQDGETVAMDEIIAELESDKATFELPAESAGVLNTIAKEGDTLAVGALVATISGNAGASAPAKPTEVKTEALASKSSVSYADKTPSPSAAKILAEKGMEPKTVTGTGIDGRITKQDALNAEKVVEIAKPKVENVPTIAPVTSGVRAERREKMTSLRKTIARRLVAVKNETAMLTTFNEVNMAPVMELRKKYKDQFKEKHGVGLGFMSFFTKAVTEALKDFPSVGARIDGEEIVYSNFADISIAVSAPKGLVVPVIRNADGMTLAQIEKEVVTLATKARDNKLSIEEMTGGNFTITNGGVFGSMLSTPIINAPQSAILGMHNIIERPVAENGQVVIRPIMYVALSYDHRIIDGRESVGFLVRVKQLLEDPTRLLLGV